MSDSKDITSKQQQVDLARAEALNQAFVVEQKKLDIAEKNLEFAQLQDGRLFEIHKKDQNEQFLERRRQWRFIYVVLTIAIFSSAIFFYFTGEKYLPDILKLAVGFIAGLSSSGFLRKIVSK